MTARNRMENQDSNARAQTALKNQLNTLYEVFTKTTKDLTERLNIAQGMDATGFSRRAELETIAEELQKLQEEVQDADAYLPDHDRARYTSTIKDIKEKISVARASGAAGATSGTKSKFSFKSGRKITAASPLTAKPGGLEAFPSLDGTITDTAASSRSSLTHLSDELSYKHLIGDVSHNGELTSFTHSIVDMRHPSLAITPVHPTLAIRDVKDSLLILGVVDGATHVTGLKNSVLVVETGQLRMHDCEDVDVYLTISSRPIIENSQGIRFAPLPTIALPTKYSKSSPSSSPKIRARSPTGERINRWSEVDDFNHLKQTPSPNWRVLPEEDRISVGIWRDVIPGTGNIGLTDILKVVGVRNAELGRSRRGSETCGGDGF